MDRSVWILLFLYIFCWGIRHCGDVVLISITVTDFKSHEMINTKQSKVMHSIPTTTTRVEHRMMTTRADSFSVSGTSTTSQRRRRRSSVIMAAPPGNVSGIPAAPIPESARVSYRFVQRVTVLLQPNGGQFAPKRLTDLRLFWK